MNQSQSFVSEAGQETQTGETVSDPAVTTGGGGPSQQGASVRSSATVQQGVTGQQQGQSVGGGTAGVEARTFPTANDLSPETRGAVVRRVNGALADTTDLMSQAKFAHWNVKGMNFYQLHLLFDELAEVFEEHADMLAERATAMGAQAMGTVRLAAARSSIPELSSDLVTGPDFLEALSAHVALHATNLRENIEFAASYGDEDTADLFTEISREVDKQLYFLESHLQTHADGTVSGLERGGRASGGTAPQGQPTPVGGVQRETFRTDSTRPTTAPGSQAVGTR